MRKDVINMNNKNLSEDVSYDGRWQDLPLYGDML